MTDGELAVEVLRDARRLAAHAPQQTASVRLALRMLRRHVPKDALIDFWNWCNDPDPIMRQQNMNRAINRIGLNYQP